jgi:hypothetical protein
MGNKEEIQSDCSAFGVAWDLQVADCLLCKEQFPLEFVECEILTKRRMVVVTDTDKGGVPVKTKKTEKSSAKRKPEKSAKPSVPPAPKEKETAAVKVKKQQVSTGRDPFGFRIGSQKSKIAGMLASGKHTLAEIKELTGYRYGVHHIFPRNKYTWKKREDGTYLIERIK